MSAAAVEALLEMFLVFVEKLLPFIPVDILKSHLEAADRKRVDLAIDVAEASETAIRGK